MNHFAKLSAVFVATASVSNADVIGIAELDLNSGEIGILRIDLFLNDDGTTSFSDGYIDGYMDPSPFTFADTSEWEPLNWELSGDRIEVQFAMSFRDHTTDGAIVNTITLDGNTGIAQGDWYDYEYPEYDLTGFWIGTGSFSVVPAPGALALIGLAGFGRRRRGSC